MGGQGTRRPVDDAACPFCLIGAGIGEATVVHETKGSIAFVPLEPAAIGHVLLAPRAHVRDVWDLDVEGAAAIARDSVPLIDALRKALHPDGLNIITSAGEAASQTVDHLHIHFVPRWNGDRFGDIWPPSPPITEQVEESVAIAIREAVGR